MKIPVDPKRTEPATGAAPAKGESWFRRSRRWLLRGLALVFAAGALVTVEVIAEGWQAFGAAPTGARLERMQGSPQWFDGVFDNPEPLWNDTWGSIADLAAREPHTSPTETPSFIRVEAERFASPPASGLRITWLGHSTLLFEIDGHRFLTDPVWGERTSPISWAGPARWFPPPLALEDVPTLDAVLLSHDHFDHLDHPTIVAMRDWDTVFVVPLGVGAHLAYWGVPEARIVEMDWWDTHAFGDLELVMTPARHASGRQLLDQNRTLWAGYALLGSEHRIFFSGDTGLFRGMTEIGDRLGPFDVTMLEVGAYGQGWPDWHLGPEQALRAHGMVRGGLFVPVHWGLFDLANHGWTEPIERVVAEAERLGIDVASPRPGESIDFGAPPPVERWWPDLPWRGEAAYPINATNVD